MAKDSLSYVRIAGVQYVSVNDVVSALLRHGQRDAATWLASSASGAVIGSRRVRV